MKKIFIPLVIVACFSCNELVKNDKKEAKAPFLQTKEELTYEIPEVNEVLEVSVYNDFLGYWVGDFKAVNVDTSISNREEYYLDYLKRITFSIDKIVKDSVFGHSIVGPSIRPFKGAIKEGEKSFDIIAKEPGDDRFDGVFNFKISKKDSLLAGKWEAYKKGKFIHTRDASLKKKIFVYDANNTLNDSYVDESKVKKYLYDQDEETGEQYFDDSYYMTTEKIFDYNPSQKVLKKEEVENFTKADIYILRNLIFARHGYVFRDKRLRQYFSYQDWYMPIFSDVAKDLTKIEKQNIDLLLRYEENAEEYYDVFGR